MVADGLSVREVKRMQTRERLLGAAMAEFKRAGMAAADVSAIVAAAGVAHGTFYFHFPTKEHVLFEVENREEDRIAGLLNRFAGNNRDLGALLTETVRLVLGLERRLGKDLFRDLLALHFSQTRPPVDDSENHAVIVLIAREIAAAQDRGEVGSQVNPMNSAVFFLLGLYALLTTMNDWASRDGVLADYVERTLDSVRSR
ncbi:TetR/AcrR family transcriptional regulator [Nocardia sp. BMG111209]|uniref:TetR/AcrR family transcriptional regulator n=1 Tax=Nocardia sp. BMG111209 TaxID=1160137 RepID=UPI00035E2CBA|nr:TetR/AcrR family transcriptional regulator [Nocardia sp. BMG111209]